MSLLPIITARTSDVLQNQRLVFQVNSDQTKLQKLYDQLSSGRRVLSGSDDPAAAARALGLNNSIANLEQMVKNAQSATGFLNTSDTALSQLDDALTSARSITVEAAQNVLGADDRTALTEELTELISRVVMIGNDAFRDAQVFGGILSSETPLKFTEGGVLFSGNESLAKPKLASATSVATLATGAEAFGLASPAIKGDPLVASLTADSRLVDVRQGEGIQPGLMRVTDGSGWIDIDLRGSVTLGDIKQRIEAVELGGRALSFAIGTDSISLGYADGLNGTLGVDDAPGSSTAAQLNIKNPTAIQAPPLVGGQLGPRTTKLTRLADLAMGAGIDVSEGIRIQEGNAVYDVDLSEAETVDDIIAAINRSGASVRAEFEATTGSIQLRLLKSGVNYSVGEHGGLAATSLGIRSSTSDVPLTSLMNGLGVTTNGDGQANLDIIRPDGTVLAIDVSGLETVGDVISAINSHPDNQDTRQVTAALASFGNGIQLTGPVDLLPIEARQGGRSNVGTALGLIPTGETSATSSVQDGISTLVGTDYTPREPGGAVDTLLRLRDAVASEDFAEIERLSQRLDGDMDRAIRTRGQIGFRTQTVDALRNVAEEQVLEMKARVSENVDADFTQIISQISTRQAAMEASLQLMGRTAGLTVLNFL